MVAHTATTPAPRTTDPLRVSAPSPHSPPARSTPAHFPTFDDSTPNTLASLLPPPTLTDQILDDLAVPQFSLSIVAMKNGLTLGGFLTWLNLPETREALALRESAAYAHARHVAALNIGHAVETVASIVRDYNTTRPAREAQDRKTPGSAHRAATNARKAAWLLLQFARIVPVNEADLRRAGGYISRPHRTANVSERTPVSHRTASVSERISSDSDSRATGCAVGGPTSATNSTAPDDVHPVPSKSASDFDALPDLHPAPSLKDDANSPAGALPDLPPASALKAEADSDDADFPSQSLCHSATPSLASRGPPW